jgi:hypothetical protein
MNRRLGVLGIVFGAAAIVYACGGGTATTDDAGADATPDVTVGVDASADSAPTADASSDSTTIDASDAATDASDAATLPTGPAQSLVLWLRADKGVTESSGGVSAWADQSGNSANATQAEAGAQPTYTTDAGLPTVTFNGSSSYLSLPAGFSDFTAGLSTFVVARLQTVTTNHASRFLDLAPTYGSLTDSILLVRWNAAGDALFYQAYQGSTPGAAVIANNAITSGTMQLYEFIVGGGDAGGTAPVTLYTNGSQVATGSANVPSVVTRSSNFVGLSNLGGVQDTYLGGDIAEVVAYKTELSAGDRAQVESYLMTKWGL